MATAWNVTATITVLGWLLSPIIALLLPKILSCLGFDASQKLQELEIHIIPELRTTLQAVDEARMLSWAKKEKPNGAVLDKMAGMLRHAQLEAEDILDLVDYHQIERKIVGEGSSWSSARAAAGRVASTCIARCNKSWLGIVRIIRGGSARLQQSSLCRFLTPSDSSGLGCLSRCFHFFNKSWLGIVHITRYGSARLQQTSLSRFLHRPNDVLPVVAAPSDDILPVDVSAPSSDEPLPVAAGGASSVETSHDEPISVTSAAPSDLSEPWLSSWCSSFDFFKNCCTSIFYWIAAATKAACFYRNWSYDWVGITNHQENATVLDSVLPAISRRNLKKRIEMVESTVSEVKKSHLLDKESQSMILGEKEKQSALNDILNMNRINITSSSSNRKVFGREELRDDIMQKILPATPPGDAPSSSSQTCYSVIGIYGVAGSGKTTLARYVLDHIKENNGEHFDTLMCIHVSETFNVDDIFHDMLKDMTKNPHSNISSREELKKKLKQNLRSKRFFLVLDDLWVKDNNYMELMELLSPLNAGMKGSKILATARIKDVVRAIGADQPIAISDLDEEQYFTMFMHCSLGRRTGIHDEEIEVAGRKIAKKLHRSPIAAVTVAGQLRGKPIRFWKATAELDVLNGTMGALWWSYMQLDVDIRRCFEYCNIFPRRISLERDELVRLWIAQGFVKTSCTTDEMEDVAERYVEELVSCSFLQPLSDGSDRFTIHDLLHDLVDRVVGNACFRIDNERSQRGKGWTGDVPRDVRHLFVYYYDAELITEILQLENLRTLIIGHVQRQPLEEKVVESISKRLLKLRVLVIGFYLSGSSTASIPQSVSQLKQLRYLGLRMDTSSMVTLPSAPTKLYHLQFLDFGRRNVLEFSTAGLINLRNVCSTHSIRLSNIGRLISLQTVPYFIVENKQGYEIKQLRDLNKIRGRLEIHGLGNVESKEEALEADLVAKKQLTEMTLNWIGGSRKCSPEVEAEVLEALCPPVGLETLEICCYEGSRYPDWMVCKQNGGPKDLKQLRLYFWKQLGPAPELETFIHLRSLELNSCDWEALPGNMEYLTLLKKLRIIGCLNIQSLPTLPQSLENFELYYCNLEALPSNMQYLTLLKKLKISWCSKIQSLPTLPQSLEKFELHCCNRKFTESCETVGHPNWQKIKHVRTKKIDCING